MSKKKSASLTQLALQKFKKNFWGVFSFVFICLCGLVALFAYLVAPDSSKNANQMHLSIHSKPPGFEVKMLSIPITNKKKQSFFDRIFFGEYNQVEAVPIERYRVAGDTLYIKEYQPDTVSEIEKSFTKNELSITENFEKLIASRIQSKTFVLGTDKYGRDLLSRILVGMRISFSIGFIAVFISLLIGISLGAIAGYYGGKVDAVIMWLINVTWSTPTWHGRLGADS